MARSLAARIAVAFAILSLALLVGVGGVLFLGLKTLHTEAQDARLSDLADGLAARTRQLVAEGARPVDIVATLRVDIPDGIAVTFRTADGRLVQIGTDGPAQPVDADPTSATGAISHGAAVDVQGRPLRYALVSIRPQATAGAARAVILSAPDVSTELAARDVIRTLPIVVVVLLVVGVPIGWLLWRSVARPLRALSDATATVPGGSATLVPVGGPTEVRELTDHFNRMTAELERRRQEEADLLVNLRHDLRTPLTVIGGFAQALGDGTAAGPDATRAAAAIAEEADRLSQMLEELDSADEAAHGMLRPEILEAHGVVAETVARFAGAAEAAGISLTAGAPEGPTSVGTGGPESIAASGAAAAGATASTAPALPDPKLFFSADPVALDRILANLVENALAAVGRGGSVVIAVRADPALGDPRRRGRGPRTATQPSGIRFSVTDDGPGFPSGTRDRVFERFFRADPARTPPGSGLGLSIVKDLARAHGGDAWAEDVIPHGGRVVVRLPSTPAPPAADTTGSRYGARTVDWPGAH